jgi:adenylosuccinate synthase
VFDFHKIIDGNLETKAGGAAIGTTRRGIGPTYTSKAKRDGIRVGELVGDWAHFQKRHTELAQSLMKMYGFEGYDIEGEQAKFKVMAEKIRPWVKDTVTLLNHSYKEGKTILAEGANAALLDLDFGTYPYVTSSSTAAGGICTGLGIAPNKMSTVFGVVKAYTTRVGAGPFPTELNDAIGEQLRKNGHEFGTTTGRPRRCGWLDIPVVRYSTFLNGYTSLNITKLDVMSDLKEIKIGTHYTIDGKRLPDGAMPSTIAELAKVQVQYETMPGWLCDISKCKTMDQLPVAARNYLKRIEELTGVPISWVGVGAGRHEMATNGFTQL